MCLLLFHPPECDKNFETVKTASANVASLLITPPAPDDPAQSLHTSSVLGHPHLFLCLQSFWNTSPPKINMWSVGRRKKGKKKLFSLLCA